MQSLEQKQTSNKIGCLFAVASFSSSPSKILTPEERKQAAYDAWVREQNKRYEQAQKRNALRAKRGW